MQFAKASACRSGEALSALLSKYLDCVIAADQQEVESFFGNFVPRSRVKRSDQCPAGRPRTGFHPGGQPLADPAHATEAGSESRGSRRAHAKASTATDSCTPKARAILSGGAASLSLPATEVAPDRTSTAGLGDVGARVSLVQEWQDAEEQSSPLCSAERISTGFAARVPKAVRSLDSR